MVKNVSIVVGVVIVVLIAAMIWMFRGQPAGETPLEVVDEEVSDQTALPLSPTEPQAVGIPTASPAASPAAGEQASVSISASGFSSATLTISVGGAVTFTNDGTSSHQVASAPHPLHTSYPPLNGPVLAVGESHSVTFTKAGRFAYHDHLNPGLTGVVVVE